LTVTKDQLINLKKLSEVSLRAAALSKERAEDELLKIKEDHHKSIKKMQAIKEELAVEDDKIQVKGADVAAASASASI
jgi:hypothetical protein